MTLHRRDGEWVFHDGKPVNRPTPLQAAFMHSWDKSARFVVCIPRSKEWVNEIVPDSYIAYTGNPQRALECRSPTIAQRICDRVRKHGHNAVVRVRALGRRVA